MLHPVAADPQAKTVIIYADADFAGKSRELGPGRYSAQQLGIGDNQLTSIRVAPGMRAILYDAPNFSADKVEITEDTRFVMPPGFNDRTSSIVVEEVRVVQSEVSPAPVVTPVTPVAPGPQVIPTPAPVRGNTVTIYSDFFHRGASIELRPGRYSSGQLGIGNNNLSSLKVPFGMKAVLFDNENFSGPALEVIEDTVGVPMRFNDLTSSLIVERVSPETARQRELNLALYEAATDRYSPQQFQKLLDQGVDVNHGAGWTCVYSRAMYQPEKASAMLKRNVIVGCKPGENGWDLLIWMAHDNAPVSAIEKILQHGGNAKWVGRLGDQRITALLFAAANGNFPSVKALVRAGADVNHVNPPWANSSVPTQTPVLAARANGWTEIVNFLEGRDNADYERSIYWAARSGNLEQIKKLVAAGVDLDKPENELNNAPILLAANNKQWAVVTYLLDQGAEADPVSVFSGVTPLRQAVLHGPTELVGRLLEQGANPIRAQEVGCGQGESIMEWAARRGYADKLALLIQGARKMNLSLDFFKERLYSRAMDGSKNNVYETVKALIDNGLKPDDSIISANEGVTGEGQRRALALMKQHRVAGASSASRAIEPKRRLDDFDSQGRMRDAAMFPQ